MPPLQGSGFVGGASPRRCPGLGSKCAFSASRTVRDGGEPSPPGEESLASTDDHPFSRRANGAFTLQPRATPWVCSGTQFQALKGRPTLCPRDTPARHLSPTNSIHERESGSGRGLVLVGRSDHRGSPFQGSGFVGGASPGRCPGRGGECAFSALGPIFLGRCSSAVSPPPSVASSGSNHFI